MQFVFQFEENIDFNMTTAKLTNLTEFPTDENNSSGTPLERIFNTHTDGIAQKTYFLQIFVTTSIGVKMAKNLLVTLLVTSVKCFTNDKPRFCVLVNTSKFHFSCYVDLSKLINFFSPGFPMVSGGLGNKS